MEEILKEANKRYPVGTSFISATGNLSRPLKITGLRLSENYKNTVVDVMMGVVYDGSTGAWAKIV